VSGGQRLSDRATADGAVAASGQTINVDGGAWMF
jgi:hypothetical protein